jgi:hypothetical protein
MAPRDQIPRREVISDDEMEKQNRLASLEWAAMAAEEKYILGFEQVAQIRPLVNRRLRPVKNPIISVPDDVLLRLASMLCVPSYCSKQFRRRIRQAVWSAEFQARKTKAAIAAQAPTIKLCIDELELMLTTAGEDTTALIEEELSSRSCGRLLECDRGYYTSIVTVRALQLDDVIKMLRAISRATDGPEDKPHLSGKIGNPGGTALKGSGLRWVVRHVLEDAESSGGRMVGGKKLINALELLRPFAPSAIPQSLPERTIKRLKAGFVREAKRRAAYEERVRAGRLKAGRL